MLRAAWRKGQSKSKETKNKIIADLSLEIIKNIRKWNNIFKREKKPKPIRINIIYPEKTKFFKKINMK